MHLDQAPCFWVSVFWRIAIYNHSRLIKDYGGVANRMPVFAAFFMLFAMSNVGLPGTAGLWVNSW